MKTNKLLLSLALILSIFSVSCSKEKPESVEEFVLNTDGTGVDWQAWSEDVFKAAKEQKKFVILDLEAIWCHWCHVMDAKTYPHPEVQKLLKEHFISVKVDQDSRPDLSNIYKDYGWPATVIFNADGSEIVKRRGYIPAEKMIELLTAVINDPNPESYEDGSVTASENAYLSSSLKKQLKDRFYGTFDSKEGGLTIFQKYIDEETMDYALVLASKGDKEARKISEKTLNSALKIFDPVWGGVYQYSTKGVWTNPHYEKLATIQGRYLRQYAQAYKILGNKKYLEASKEVYRYIKEFLTSPSGTFYTSQDADLVKGKHSDDYFNLDDKKRRKKGIPKVDKNIYSYQNGRIIDGLVSLYNVTNQIKYLEEAQRAADWILSNRSIPGGGLSHGEDKVQGPYLNDNVHMGIALMNLYMSTADRDWLSKADRLGTFVLENFKDAIGFQTVALSNLPKAISKPKPVTSENISTVRFLNLLHHFTGKQEYKTAAEHGMKFLATNKVALKTITEPGILLADMELANDPPHVTVVGSKNDPKARELFLESLRYPTTFYKRVEWYDINEGLLANHDVEYPELDKAAAFGCANQTCSLPVFETADLFETISAMSASEF